MNTTLPFERCGNLSKQLIDRIEYKFDLLTSSANEGGNWRPHDSALSFSTSFSAFALTWKFGFGDGLETAHKTLDSDSGERNSAASSPMTTPCPSFTGGGRAVKSLARPLMSCAPANCSVSCGNMS